MSKDRSSCERNSKHRFWRILRVNIVFLARNLELTPDLVLNRGIGGSESALVYAARTLSGLGNTVTVYTRSTKPFEVDGVVFSSEGRLRQGSLKRADIVILFRFLDEKHLEKTRGGKVVLWLHDDYSRYWFDREYRQAFLDAERNTVSRIFVVSRWHRKVIRDFIFQRAADDSRFFVTANGIPFEFEEELDLRREEKGFVYTSVLNRGFASLMDIAEELEKRIPDARIRVCTSYPGELDFFRPHGPNIVFLGHLDRKELRDILWQSSLFLYPGHPFPGTVGALGYYAETSCIAALEAQACGAPVVAGRRGGLEETVRDGETGLLIGGDPLSDSRYSEDFIAAVVKLASDGALLASMRENARRHVLLHHRWSVIIPE